MGARKLHSVSNQNDSVFLRAFIEAVEKVFLLQLGIRPQLSSSPVTTNCDLEVVLELRSTAFNGTLVFGIGQSTYLKILALMLGETIDPSDPVFKDGACELTNMIFGHAKITLNSNGFDFTPSLPKLETGANQRLKAIANWHSSITFQTENGPFRIDFYRLGSVP